MDQPGRIGYRSGEFVRIQEFAFHKQFLTQSREVRKMPRCEVARPCVILNAFEREKDAFTGHSDNNFGDRPAA